MMGLMDLFRPKWKHSNWMVRKEAVEKEIADQSILSLVARNDPDEKIRIAAVEKLADQAVLAEVARSAEDQDVRSLATMKLIDQATLCEIASHDAVGLVRLHAVRQLQDQELLFRIADSDLDEFVREAATEKLSNQDALARVALDNSSADSRKAATKKINDQEILVRIAKNDPVESNRAAAVERITDPKILGEVARSDPDDYVRGSALDRVTDQSVLEEIARNDPEVYIRREAVKKLSDQELLAEISLSDKDKWVRNAAAEKIGNQETLTHIAENDPEADVRETAIEKITDQLKLVELFKSKNYQTRELAARRLSGQKLDDSAISSLSEVLQNDPDRQYDAFRLLAACRSEKALMPMIAVARKYADTGYMSLFASFGDLRASECIINWLAESPIYEDGSDREDLLKNLRLLWGGHADIVVGALSGVKRASKTSGHGEERWIESSYSTEKRDQAIKKLVGLKGSVWNNILHKVAETKDCQVTMTHIIISSVHQRQTEELRFDTTRQLAMEELNRRGNPSYDTGAYLDRENWK